MTPIKFPEVNVTYAEDQLEYQPLPVLKRPDGIVVSCWELTDEEIEQIKTNKCLWLSVMTFNQPLQPLFLTTDKSELFTKAIAEESDLEECIGCTKKFDYEIMVQDNASENYCPECWEHFKTIFKAEYEEMVKNGEINAD